MVVIHISGTAGSGKSHIGDLMQRIYPDTKLHVVDLDAMFKQSILRTQRSSAETQLEAITRDMQSRIAALRKKYSNLLLTGYSDVVVNGKVRYIELDADVKYFIDIPMPQLIQQYWHRERVATTRDTMSDTALRKMARADRMTYRQFQIKPQLEIVRCIILRLGR